MADNGHINANGNIVKVGRDGVAYPWFPSESDLVQRAIDEAKHQEAVAASAAQARLPTLEERVAAIEAKLADKK